MRHTAFILLALITGFKSIACDCAGLIGINEANAVFEGKVIGIEKVESPNIYYKIKFRVSKVTKGKVKSSITVVNCPSMNAAACGIPFEINGSYEVFTFIQNNKLFTNDCTKTRKLDEE